ncbi:MULTISPECIES: helix-turn-helix domain-containing protein [Chryseobacterium]|uniref:Transcriptional regulator with XRE-family HTH domain n=1 Tax=Chryseobacterium camelliae TaxID=1265445 RepID=A0ABU0TDS5_9FLAO|nr:MULTISPECIES: helix-turn-helix transcriptional regulator [Chryseobacterium]MDT3406977.1 transcriptional regulator with XRE-family HTH domain [Pseudacidovorax intermedius]MDQ1095230.1 transcriptional regulator with XRE-family HTH domain [Chryseobacterium camelliae]MDQ1099168.1 transcriptional regulator with XRE-family HTH domain [Chryseobacterium sp. SORGH_AS_1048]MDR6086517.1 transcriptional regulator with XRE-family HTH domain [Chryseobacterium sp. SORGH_AS_0909]MDR6130888.1 transcriptiona
MEDIQDKYFIAIADYVKNFIDEEGIDVADLAAAANVDRKQVYRLIKKENMPRLSTLLKISLAAGIEPSKLFSIEFDFKIYMKENNILKASSRKKAGQR